MITAWIHVKLGSMLTSNSNFGNRGLGFYMTESKSTSNVIIAYQELDQVHARENRKRPTKNRNVSPQKAKRTQKSKNPTRSLISKHPYAETLILRPPSPKWKWTSRCPQHFYPNRHVPDHPQEPQNRSQKTSASVTAPGTRPTTSEALESRTAVRTVKVKCRVCRTQL